MPRKRVHQIVQWDTGNYNTVQEINDKEEKTGEHATYAKYPTNYHVKFSK